MNAGLAARPEPNVRVEMKAHRERLKLAVHPGVTQKEAGLTAQEADRLVRGVCADLADSTARGERIAHRVLLVLVVVLLLALGLTAMNTKPVPVSQTVQAGVVR